MKQRAIAIYVAMLVGTAGLSAIDTNSRPMNFAAEQRLSNNYVMGIAQDRYGFVWVSTESGLNRFDGRSFKSFTKLNSALPANELNGICYDDADNVLWIATQRHGLCRLDCDSYQFTIYVHQSNDAASPASDGITDVTRTGNGNIYVATYTDGLDYYDKKTGQFTHYNTRTTRGWPNDQLWCVTDDGMGNVYLGHVNAGLTVFNPSTGYIKNYRAATSGLPDDQVRCVYVDKHGHVWVGSNGGLSLFNPERGSFVTYSHDSANPRSLLSNTVYDVCLTDDDKLWVTTENGGVSILDAKDIGNTAARFTNLPMREGNNSRGISNKTARCVFQDSFGNVLIGTYGDGIDVFSKRRMPFTLYDTTTKPYDISYTAVMSLCMADSTLYVGTDDGGIDVVNTGGRTATYDDTNSALRDNAVLSSIASTEGYLLFGTYTGQVVRLDKATHRMTTVALSPSTDVRCFAQLADGRIAIGNGYGIAIYDGRHGSIAKYYQAEGKLRETWVRALLDDGRGHLWVGSFGDGISVYELSTMRRLKTFSSGSGLNTNTINHMVLGRNGNVYAATDDGLVVISPSLQITRIITTTDGLANAGVRSLVFDNSGNLYAGTATGVSVLSPTLEVVGNYGMGDGLSGGDFACGCVAKEPSGNIFFGSHYGLWRFDPQSTTSAVKTRKVVVSSFMVYGDADVPPREIYVHDGATVELPYNENTFRMYLGVLDASVAGLMECRYKLDGFDSRWVQVGIDDAISFRNIPPGSYKIVIRSKIRNHSAPEAETVIPIVIKPPIYATWWAKLLYVLISIAVVLATVLFYKKRLALEYALTLERKNNSRQQELIAERMRFFTNITHELRTPLTLIIGPLEDLLADKGLSARITQKISVIHKSASRLLELINTILEFRKTETQNRELKVAYGDLARVVNDIGTRYSQLNTNTALQITTRVEHDSDDGAADGYKLWFDRDVVYMIIDNLMSNACKYTADGSVVLSLRHTSESGVPFTEVTVHDTGLGISSEALPRIFDRYYRDGNSEQRLGTGIGLALVYNLAKIHEGEIFVESELHRGTTFRFRLRTFNTYPGATRLNSAPASSVSAAAGKADSLMSDHDYSQPTDAKPLVLIVEDNIDIINYVCETLADDYSVISAINGVDGLAKARHEKPDMIITDIMMPQMDGIEMVKALKADIDTSHIPVVIITAKTTTEARIQAYQAGADSFITKPFSSSLLRSRLSNLLNMRHRLAAATLVKEPQPQAPDAATEAATGIIVSAFSAADNEFLQKVKDIIHANISNDGLDVGFIADKMYMSHSTLYRKVKAVTGLSVAGLVRKLRARRAGELLAEGSHTVSEVAYMVGMSSLGNFRQCFKEEFGISPSEYIKNAR